MDAEEERVFLLWGFGHSQLGCLCPSGWPHTHVHMGSTTRTQGFININNDDNNNKDYMKLGGLSEDSENIKLDDSMGRKKGILMY